MATLERYELIRLLGRGAAGDVYVARDRLSDGREVALKRIRARVDDRLREAFEREFATMASLSVAGVAPVFDFGILPATDDEPGGPFYTRGYIDGEPLDVAAEGRPPLERLRLFCRVARIIAPLHRVGVVHGDIKPGNSVVDGSGRAHLIDFGLSRVLGQPAAGSKRKRSEDASSSSGTPPFMAPELLHGSPPSVPADIYALGVTLWLILSGEQPFAKWGAGGLRAKLDGEQPDLPEGCDDQTRAALTVALRAMAPEPLDRFPTVAEMIVALEEIDGGLREETDSRFVPPRARGREAVLDRLQATLLSAAAGVDAGRSGAHLLIGPQGSGKTSLLTELKWRLQLHGVQVLEAPVRGGGATAPVASLLRKMIVQLGEEDPRQELARELLASLGKGQLDQGAVSNALAELFAATSSQGRLVLLVDDLDLAEGLHGEILRSAIHAEVSAGVSVVATASHAGAPAVRGLGADDNIPLEPLSATTMDALATESLGAVDSSVLEALRDHCQGLPAGLIDALSQLGTLSAPTVEDVKKLEPGHAGLAMARARLAAAPANSLRLLSALHVAGGSLPRPFTGDALLALSVPADEHDALIVGAQAAGLLVVVGEEVSLADLAIDKVVDADLDPGSLRETAASLLAAATTASLSGPLRARLAVAAGDAAQIKKLVPGAAAALVALGAHGAAADLQEALERVSSGAARRTARLALARACHGKGDHERAAELARSLTSDSKTDVAERSDAAIVAAQAYVDMARYDDAVEALSLIPRDADGATRARLKAELARVHLRRGDYEALDVAAIEGLSCEGSDDVVRSQLLCSRGIVASYRSEHDQAGTFFDEAVDLARRAGARREEANALTYRGMGYWRAGDLVSARDLLAQSLEIAREAGDTGSMATFSVNLGAILFYLGEPTSAAEHYETGARLARRAGKPSTDAMARNNLAHVHIYFGLYERARLEVTDVMRDAKALGYRYVVAQATGLLGDLAARAGDIDQALVHYDDAIARYSDLGQTREVAEHNMDAAEALLDRSGPADGSAAAARLGAARDHIEREHLEDLRLGLDLCLARTRVASGDPEGAIETLEDVVDKARKAHHRDVEWSALYTISLAQQALGADFAARRYNRMAVEVLEDIALRIPRQHREAFWHDPRRRAVRVAALHTEDSSHGMMEGTSTLLGDPRAERLLEIIKRLAGEHDLDRLLERITESAVDLSGAERGFVLLVDRDGQLETHTVSEARPGQGSAHAFSRSIAEAVLIDSEPIITVDAADDGRLSEYVSVHQMMLRSVACLPIRGRSGTVGVLYLEHRRSRGRFTDSAVDLLFAFADQAAIALENARLMSENQQRQRQLEEANDALSGAKQDLEELLSARTEQLQEAQKELTRARSAATRDSMRHGMIGRSEAMLRVFETIDRVCDAQVPIVITGESGTGKELVARAVHYGGARARAPFIAINCGSLPETLLESELFGHTKGSFSGADRDKRGMIARASGGTLLLDEVGDMPAKMQVDMLRVLQEGVVTRIGSDQDETVDVRYISATNKPLGELVAGGAFREDLFYRLNVVEIVLPPLRRRRDDIPLLCEHFLRAFAKREDTTRKRLSRDAVNALRAHNWPGNVRQLEHVLVQACVMIDGNTIDAVDLALDAPGHSLVPPALDSPEVAAENVEDHKLDEKRRILQALEVHNWNRARAAKALGIPRRTFYRRLQDYDIIQPTDVS